MTNDNNEPNLNGINRERISNKIGIIGIDREGFIHIHDSVTDEVVVVDQNITFQEVEYDGDVRVYTRFEAGDDQINHVESDIKNTELVLWGEFVEEKRGWEKNMIIDVEGLLDFASKVTVA